MLLPIKAIISKKVRKDGTSIIFFQYCFSSTNRVLLNTEIAIPTTYWNAKRQCISKSLPPDFGNYDCLNNEITRMKRNIENLIDQGLNLDAPNIGTYVKSLFKPDMDIEAVALLPIPKAPTKKEPDFFNELDSYIKTKQITVCKATVATLEIMKNRMKAFEAFRKKAITFSSLDFNLYSELMEFLIFHYTQRRKKEPVRGLKVSTIGKTIKLLRLFIKDRVKRKIIAAIDMDDFKVVDEETDAIYLSYDEVGTIYALDLSHEPILELYRDMFVFGCLSGLRFSDYSNLSWNDMRNGLLYKKTEKMDTWVVIPLRKEAGDIFAKHYKQSPPKISNPVFNRYIKIIAKMAGITELVTFSHKRENKSVIETKPKCEWVTSHTCRRSFCTNEYLAGTDINLIMKISGHKTHKDFFKYIRVTQEEAAYQIQDIWSKRNNMAAFSLRETVSGTA